MARIESGKEFDKDAHHEKMMKSMNNEDTIQYPFRIPKSLYKKVKIKLANDEVKLREVLLGMLEEYIKK